MSASRGFGINSFLQALALAVLLGSGQLMQATNIPQSAPGPIGEIALFSSGSGYVVAGGRLMWTDDWGSSWSDRTPPISSDQSIGGIYFKSELTGWIEVHGAAIPAKILIGGTTDGGKTWTIFPFRALPSDLGRGYAGSSAISFTDRLHGR